MAKEINSNTEILQEIAEKLQTSNEAADAALVSFIFKVIEDAQHLKEIHNRSKKESDEPIAIEVADKLAGKLLYKEMLDVRAFNILKRMGPPLVVVTQEGVKAIDASLLAQQPLSLFENTFYIGPGSLFDIRRALIKAAFTTTEVSSENLAIKNELVELLKDKWFTFGQEPGQISEWYLQEDFSNFISKAAIDNELSELCKRKFIFGKNETYGYFYFDAVFFASRSSDWLKRQGFSEKSIQKLQEVLEVLSVLPVEGVVPVNFRPFSLTPDKWQGKKIKSVDQGGTLQWAMFEKVVEILRHLPGEVVGFEKNSQLRPFIDAEKLAKLSQYDIESFFKKKFPKRGVDVTIFKVLHQYFTYEA